METLRMRVATAKAEGDKLACFNRIKTLKSRIGYELTKHHEKLGIEFVSDEDMQRMLGAGDEEDYDGEDDGDGGDGNGI